LAQVTWLSGAIADVEDICGFIAEESPRSAATVARRLYAAADRLFSFPASGRVVPEIDDEDVREIIVGNYRVMYRILPNEVEVMTVVHGARLFHKEKERLAKSDD